MVFDELEAIVVPDEETALAEDEARATNREQGLRAALVAAEADARAVGAHLDELRTKVQALAQQAPEGSALSRLCARIDSVRLPALDPALRRFGLDARREVLTARHNAVIAAEAQLALFRDEVDKLYAQIAVGATAMDAYAKRRAATDAAPGAAADRPRLVLRDTTPRAPPAAPPTAPAAPDERSGPRASPRVPLEVALTFESHSNFYVGFARDISRGGVFVATDAPLPQGTPVGLELALPDGTLLSVAGEVRWAREYDRSVPEMIPGMGIQFASLSTEALASIESFVSTRVPLMIPS